MSEAHSTAPTRPMLDGVTPILRVENLPASIAYYQEKMGFSLNWHAEGIMASVSRDRCSIMLCEGAQGAPSAGSPWEVMGLSDRSST